MLSHRPQGPGGQGAGPEGRGSGPGAQGEARGAVGPEPGGRAGGLKSSADGQTDSAVTHKVESTTNSTGGCSVSYFMDECTVGFGDHAAAAAAAAASPPSGPRATGEPRGRPPRAARTPERPPLPAVARAETRPGLLGCPEGRQVDVWTQCSRRGGPAAARPSADGCRMSKRRERGGDAVEAGAVPGTPTLIKSGLLSCLRLSCWVRWGEWA
ncbi:PREDICTED: uncharacterized protein LOC108638221 [Capra hircus]|uniref:uncharacterized protein LOC108638221 n=1 Tax=Capra hircus TaxID=9925 RepID=UPI000846DF7C|nr:PREDICTED: uncharacterized protein LOC108638221 [Capra hircus]